MIISLKRLINRKVTLDRAIISDILLWLALTALLAYLIYLLAIALPARRGQLIELGFRNANEISRGAPVRLMGTDIGFVDNVQIRADHVNVTVQTNPDAIKIPSGAVFTILFTGLGGAKSIEVSLPEKPMPEVDGDPVYLVKEPISMRDTLNASLDSTQALQKGSENISDFFGKKKPVEELQVNIHETEAMSKVALQHTIGLNRNLGEMRQEIHEYSQTGANTIAKFNHGAEIMARGTNPQKMRQQILLTTHYLKSFNQAFATETGLAVTLPARLNQFNQNNTKIGMALLRLDRKVSQAPIPQWLKTFHKTQTMLNQTIQRMDGFFDKDPASRMVQARQKIQQFNQQVLLWTAKVERAQQKSGPPVPKQPSSHLPKPTKEQPVALSDRFGNRLSMTVNGWWRQPQWQRNQPVAKPLYNPQDSTPPAEPEKTWEPGVFAPVFEAIQPVWDAICFLFR